MSGEQNLNEVVKPTTNEEPKPKKGLGGDAKAAAKPQSGLGGDVKATRVRESSSKADFTIIGVGQGGNNIGTTLVSTLGVNPDNFIVINMSQADLSVSSAKDDNKIKFGKTEGAGKNRDLSKEEIKANMHILEGLVTKHHSKIFGPNKIVIVAYSTGGGTGSGTGTLITTYLTQYVLSKKEEIGIVNTPQVIGLAIMPILNHTYDAGEKSYQNTLECLSEIQSIVSKRLGTFCLIDNDTELMAKDPLEIYKTVNQRVADGFKRFFIDIGKSEANADLQDRLTALEHPGIFGIYGVEKKYQFLVPQQMDPAKLMVAEIPEGDNNVELLRKFLRDNGIKSNEEIIAHSDNPEGVVGLFAVDCVSKLVEPIRQKLEDNIIRSVKNATQIKQQAVGFNGMESSREHIRSQSEKHSTDLNDISNLF